jgi:hypothetical protein
MHGVGWTVLTPGLAPFIFLEHFSFETVPAVVATEANTLSHS